MGDFGKFKINTAITGVAHGSTELGPFEEGAEFEPTDADELEAMQHLCGVSFTPEGGESVTYATQTEHANPPEPVGEPDVGADMTLPEPPAKNDDAGDKTVPAPELFTFAGDPAAIDTAAWPLADVETTDGAPLYTWGGSGSAPISPEWLVYVGETKPVDKTPKA